MKRPNFNQSSKVLQLIIMMVDFLPWKMIWNQTLIWREEKITMVTRTVNNNLQNVYQYNFQK